MTGDGQNGIKELMGMLKALKGSTLSSMLDKTNLSEEDKKAISALFEQFSREQTLDGDNKQNAMNIIQRLVQQSKVEGQQEKIGNLLNKVDQNTKLSDGDKKIMDELKKLL
ncbi:MAG: hypothetical protein M0021_14785 [Clostridia bacterium]|nr:hypothetical protein [Clostridia bacterium]